MAKRNIFIDARCLVRSNPSGIGHYMGAVLKGLDEFLDEIDAPRDIRYHLVVPFRLVWRLNTYQFRNFKVHRIFLPMRAMNLLARKRWLPPFDALYGRGLYVFPDFIRLPLLFSKSLSIIYDAGYRLYPDTVLPKLRRLLEHRVPRAIRQSTGLLGISKSAVQDITKFYKEARGKFTIIVPPIDKTLFYPRSHAEITRIRARYDIYGDYMLTVGNLEPRKNFTTLAAAYAALPKALREKYSLVIVGADSWNSEDIMKTLVEYKEAGLKILLRLRTVTDSDMPALYSGASLFVFPSLYEGFGIPPLEAMACGAPVLSTNNSALPEAIGTAARIITNPLDTKAMSQSLVSILEDAALRAELRQAGFEHIDKHLTYRQAGEDFHALVTKLWEGRT